MSQEAQKTKLPTLDGTVLKPCGILFTWKSIKEFSADIRASPIFPQYAHLTISSQQSRGIAGNAQWIGDRSSYLRINQRAPRVIRPWRYCGAAGTFRRCGLFHSKSG